jgi:hypothetical protein
VLLEDPARRLRRPDLIVGAAASMRPMWSCLKICVTGNSILHHYDDGTMLYFQGDAFESRIRRGFEAGSSLR